MKILKTLFGLPVSTSNETILSKLYLHSAEEIAQKQATRVYGRCGHAMQDIIPNETRNLRSGRLLVGNISRNLRTDFFSHILRLKDAFDEERFNRYKGKELPDNFKIAKWVARTRKRINLIIKRSKKKSVRPPALSSVSLSLQVVGFNILSTSERCSCRKVPVTVSVE